MKRYTGRLDDDSAFIGEEYLYGGSAGRYYGEAADRLADFEDFLWGKNGAESLARFAKAKLSEAEWNHEDNDIRYWSAYIDGLYAVMRKMKDIIDGGVS